MIHLLSNMIVNFKRFSYLNFQETKNELIKVNKDFSKASLENLMKFLNNQRKETEKKLEFYKKVN